MLDFKGISALFSYQAAGGRASAGADKAPDRLRFDLLLLELQMRQMQAWNGSPEGKPNPGLNPNETYRGILQRLSALKGFSGEAGPVPRVPARRAVGQYRLEHSRSAVLPAKDVSFQPKPETISALADRTAKKHGIPETLFERLIRQESGFNPLARSPRGAMGLGQLMPPTARELGLRVGSRGDRDPGSVWHPESNLNAAAGYLKKLHRLYRGKAIPEQEAWSFAAGAYNAGMGNIQKALDRLGNPSQPRWEQVASVLHEVTGSASAETLHYVNRLRG